MAATQTDLFRSTPPWPEGLRYRADFVSPEEEGVLTAAFADLPFRPFEFQGFLGKRRIVAFGSRYDFSAARLEPAPPLPDFLLPLRERAAAFAGLPEAALKHAMVTEYAPGAPIGWHRDRPQFDSVIGVSLASACTFRLRRRHGSGWERAAFTAEPRSVYILQGQARTEWEHSIPPVEALRYSVTFRSLRTQAQAA